MAGIRLDQWEAGSPTTAAPSSTAAPSQANTLPTVMVGGVPHVVVPSGKSFRLQAVPKPAEPKVSKEQERAQITQEGANVLRQHLDVIKGSLDKIHAPENPVTSTVVGHLRGMAGTMDPTFQRANDDIQASIGPFITAVDGIAKGRINIVELKNMAGLIKNLPYLPPTEQAKNFAEIDAMLKKGGVPIQFGASSTANDPHLAALQQQFPGAKITKVK